MHVITGVPSSRYECVPHKRVGVPLQTTIETLYVNHGIDLNGSVRLLLFGTAGGFFFCFVFFVLFCFVLFVSVLPLLGIIKRVTGVTQ